MSNKQRLIFKTTMSQLKFTLKDPNTNWKYFLIVIVLASIAGGGILSYQCWLTQKETEIPFISPVVEKQPKLSLVGSVELRNKEVDILYLSGKYAYIGKAKNLLEIVDVSNPSQPVIIGSEVLAVDMEQIDFYVSGNLLYIAGDSGIGIIDISDPRKPHWISGGYDNQGVVGRCSTGIDNYLFLGTTNGLLILDISNPTKPVLVGSYKGGIYDNNVYDKLWVDDIYISGNYVYVVGSHSSSKEGIKSDTFLIFDVSDKTKPVLVGRDNTLTLPRAIYIVNKTAYITELGSEEGQRALKIFDVSDPTNITLLGSYSQKEWAENIFVKDVYVLGQYAFVSYTNGLLVLGISNPAKPTLIEDISGSPQAITGSGNYIYSVIPNPDKYGSSILQIFEIKYK